MKKVIVAIDSFKGCRYEEHSFQGNHRIYGVVAE